MVAAENDAIESAAAELRTRGADVRAVRADLATPEGVEDLVAVALERPVDVLAANAGVGVGGDFVDDSDVRAHLRVVDLNVRSTVHLSKRLLPEMVERGAGSRTRSRSPRAGSCPTR